MSGPHEGQRFGHWVVAALDASGRRALCRCRCHTLRQVATAELANGTSTSCGCAPMPGLWEAVQELREVRRRARDLDWRPIPDGGRGR